MNLGINFLDLYLGRFRFLVDKYALSPTAKSSSTIGMPSLRDMALYNGIICYFQVVYGLVYKSFNARFGVLKGSYPSNNSGHISTIEFKWGKPHRTTDTRVYGK